MHAADRGAASGSRACEPLSGLGRSVYVSQRGLEHVLTELREKNLLAEDLPSSRSSVKRAREDSLATKTGRFGSLIQHMYIPTLSNPDKKVKVPFISPSALLGFCAQQKEFGEFLIRRLQDVPSTFQTPWRIAVYCDEVTPGNNLKSKNFRKTQAVYWSYLGFGQRGLTAEALWFPLLVLRSQLCNDLGGMSVVWKHALRLFFQEHDHRMGWFLETPHGGITLYADLGVMIADEAALKQSVENKGASGVVFCMRCSNVVRHDLMDVDHNAVVRSTCTDVSQFRLHTNQSTRDILLYLQSQEAISTKKRFSALETALGYNHRPDGLLMDDIGFRIPECIMFDWFHIYLVHGICGNHCGCLLGTLKDAGIAAEAISHFLESFRWPAQFAGANPKNILKAPRDSKCAPLKAAASEMLNFLPVMRLFLLLFVIPRATAETLPACRCFLLLMQVMDLLQEISKGKPVSATSLQAAIRRHGDAFLEAHGSEHWVPKNHMSFHLPEFLRRHGTLISCWTHERKHKVLKRFATQSADTSRGWETSLLKDCLDVQLEAMQSEMPSTDVRLLDKRPATKGLQTFLQDTLQAAPEVPCYQGRRAVHGGGFTCQPGDVVVYRLQGVDEVAQISFHAQVGDSSCITCINPWRHVHEHMYEVRQEPTLIYTSAIQSCCIWSQKERSAMVLRP